MEKKEEVVTVKKKEESCKCELPYNAHGSTTYTQGRGWRKITTWTNLGFNVVDECSLTIKLPTFHNGEQASIWRRETPTSEEIIHYHLPTLPGQVFGTIKVDWDGMWSLDNKPMVKIH